MAYAIPVVEHNLNDLPPVTVEAVVGENNHVTINPNHTGEKDITYVYDRYANEVELDYEELTQNLQTGG